ncbi:EI24 domain-containing protein [Roseovarius sp. Pro17]|uniref:EI24 domain-containing protein n=1 Tax=Roseovarius sp. Pro17 TaxID=3108175 RepID=UPI002D776BC9|nr:EI24 domain-containing protein [Roseovarius sp. Pro17]
MIFSSFTKALSQMGDPRFRRVLILGVALTVALLFAVYAIVLLMISWLTGEAVSLPWVGEVRWLDDLLGWTSLVAMMVMSIFLMVPVATAITGLFLDDVAAAVEARHYPDLPPVPRMPWMDTIRDTLGFLGVLIGANLLALILYIALPFGAFAIFWALNGFLLGREYFQLAAMRRLGRAGARDLRRRHWLRIWGAGVLMAIPLSIPLVNLVIPILGAATFTHLVHALRPGQGRTG